MNTRVKIWLQALRPFSFTASMIPVLVGAALAFTFADNVAWYLLPLVLICAALLHAATNVLNDYFDYTKGVDTRESFGSSRVLVDNLESPLHILILGCGLFITGFLLSLILIFLRGMPLFFLALAGFLGVLFYTGQPFGYKYLGLGDIFVFLFMGPLLVIGSFFCLAGTYTHVVLYVSLPIGFLVTAIVSSNNLRDIVHDRKAKIITLENTIGFGASKVLCILLIFAAYLTVIVLIVAGMLKPIAVLVFLSLPLSLRNIVLILASSQEEGKKISKIDIFSAQMHMAFGLLLIISIMGQRVLR